MPKLNFFSIAAIESASKDDDTQWLTYWVIFGLLNIGEFFSQTIVYYFPFYWLLKVIYFTVKFDLFYNF